MNGCFKKVIFTDKIKFKYIKGLPEKSGLEIHPFHEILYLADGDATFYSKYEKYSVPVGSILIIPAQTYHRFEIENKQDYTRILFNFYDFSECFDQFDRLFEKNITVVETLSPSIASIIKRLFDYVDLDITQKDRELLVHSCFFNLIVELIYSEKKVLDSRQNPNSLITGILTYIDENFNKPISSDEIAKALYVSRSTVEHIFKLEMNIPIYRYITEKRLVYAHDLITKQVPPTQVMLLSGFNDYSVFYRAFKKMFGVGPSKFKSNISNEILVNDDIK